MSGGWYGRVSRDINDLSPLVDAVEYYDNELIEARKELDVSGNIEAIQKKLPGVMAYRFSQLQEIEAILEFLEINYRKVKGTAYRKYLESHPRALTSRDAEKYAECDVEVLEAALLVNQVALIRNNFLGITKGIEMLHFQLSSIVRMRVAGIEDATL